jgi:hypothetical protein
MLIVLAVAGACRAAAADPTTAPVRKSQPVEDRRTFELHPVAPPTPALKYQLLYEPALRRPGNAAIEYLQAASMLGPDIYEKLEKAIGSQGTPGLADGDATAQGIADELISQNKTAFQFLDTAARCEMCDWQPQLRFEGVHTLLPHLSRNRALARLISVKATREAQLGRPDDAIKSLRWGYELARRQGEEPVLVSGLVAIGIGSSMNDSLAGVMNRPDSPNLYWALVNLPRPMISMRTAWAGERILQVSTIPPMLKARTGQEITGDDWPAMMRDMASAVNAISNGDAAGSGMLTVDELGMTVTASFTGLPAARSYYARTRHIRLDEANKVDPKRLLAVFFIERNQQVADDIEKLIDLPYPTMASKLHDLSEQVKKDSENWPTDPFRVLLPAIERLPMTYIRLDRQTAALIAVEAIRSYAASHNGRLPDRLQDITDTPVLDNPATGKPFEYRLEGETATLSAAEMADYPLVYTIRIRK